MSNCFDERECDDRARRSERKFSGIRGMLEAGYEKSSRVRRIMEEKGLAPADFRSEEDFERLPVISRETLIQWELDEPPYGGLADPAAAVDRIFISPGPVYEPHLGDSDYLWARAYHAAGIGKGDRVLNAFSYHLVAAGLTFHAGLRRVGATVIPSGSSGAQMQVELIRDLSVTAYTGTPSFLMAIIKKAEEMGYDWRKDFHVRKACFAAEPLWPAMREVFTNEYGIDTYQMYGATEVGDVAYECQEKKGWHVCEEVLVEICDPVTGKRLPTGELGQVVVTRFNDLFFLLRFGTGDLSRLVAEPCRCGRTAYRLDGIAGRIGDAIKVRGLFIAPSQIKRVAERYPERKFQVCVRRDGHKDLLVIRIEDNERSAEAGSDIDDEFAKYFRMICTVGIDRMEWVPSGTLKPEEKMLADERSWQN